ncbi:MAG: hypothetical protein [Chaetfec virus UA24_144]|nr:MAG: hypothetical protein [Chaetfec virus UA24_144]
MNRKIPPMAEEDLDLLFTIVVIICALGVFLLCLLKGVK